MKIAAPMPQPGGFALPRPPVLTQSLPQPPIPIIVTSKGVSNGVQKFYAGWDRRVGK